MSCLEDVHQFNVELQIGDIENEFDLPLTDTLEVTVELCVRPRRELLLVAVCVCTGRIECIDSGKDQFLDNLAFLALRHTARLKCWMKVFKHRISPM